MASSTNNIELSSQQKAELDEMIKEAENSCLSDEIFTRVIVLEGYLSKSILLLRPLNLIDSNLWAGNTAKDYPHTLDGPISSTFTQASVKDDGIMAAVVYAGKNIVGVECGWLLAWADSKANGKRLYAECGDISKYNCIDWGCIEEKLNNSKKLAIIVSDHETGTSVQATLSGVDFPLQTQDKLGAIFYG
ncbi:jasmonate-induced protein homolog [Chenopodium quinoa]|uniref:Uncharacterized protein n=1 Tax=Chenopodium quinoa TaxID=63459 RepID=A0A803KUT3_CHEQI|nr:jasmonate-induced protein homolog [Chenopodium quinoa]XP_021750415.1 jasmonate-induced protein homolog [Chenopodium quinoa]XP_021750461.1 jasmonate-induced protein homolog [Chenopodium quinoa]XP_021750506.1 jasmonate-induced protein homolog [Chenopodium quinoa]XP_021750550.1 jasmonate-induced protein homolog [Chenopodium quinoa]